MPLVIDSEVPPVGWPYLQHGIAHVRQDIGARHGFMAGEEAGVSIFSKGQIHAARDGQHGGRYLVADAIGLDLHLAGIADRAHW